MHIEPGYIAPAKVLFANGAAVGVVGYYVRAIVCSPWDIAKAALAAVFFSLFMQSFHMNVGPSELHFVGASAMYLTLGFLPTLIGFSVGLLLQGLLFEPGDLPHLAVNSLSLIVPLLVVHYTVGRRLFDEKLDTRVTWAQILRIDAIYYTGVTTMVGFWLLIGEVQTPFAAWAAFAGSYIAIVALEPVFTLLVVKGLKRIENSAVVSRLFIVHRLRTA